MDLFNTFLPIVVIGLIGLVVGALFGVLLSGGLGGSTKPDSKTPGKDYVQSLRVWRERRSGKLILDLEDNLYPSAEKMTPRQRTSVQQTVDEVYLWLGMNVTALKVPSPIISTPPPVFESGLPTAAAGISPVQVSAAGVMSAAIPQVLIPETKGKEKEKEAPKSIAAQVDEILQEKLPQSNMSQRAIRLIELPLRGLVVMVDGQAYEGVGDVPDEEVRKLIQECVSEWERTR